MRRTLTLAVVALAAGCASPNAPIPGHNHPDGVVVAHGAGTGVPDAARLAAWTLTITGAT